MMEKILLVGSFMIEQRNLSSTPIIIKKEPFSNSSSIE